jgi:flavin reductase (DIM6/NTAB) family NADH-FMN oxidoreductase RutF
MHTSSSDSQLARIFRRAASFIPTGVAILSADDIVMTVSSLHCVSFEPPMVSVALARDSSVGSAIRSKNRFRVRLLSHGEESVARGGAIPPGPRLVDLACTATATHPAGDHYLVLATVVEAAVSHGFPLVYWRRGLHGFRPQYKFLESRETLRQFLAAWESGTLRKTEWTHAAHVAVGSCYAVQFPGTALERTRNGIRRYNQAVGTKETNHSGYHETLTRFWSLVLAQVVKEFSDSWEAACHAVERLGEDRDLHNLYYSFDVVRNPEARRTWVPPDLNGPYWRQT